MVVSVGVGEGNEGATISDPGATVAAEEAAEKT